MIADIHEAHVLAGARDRIDRSRFALPLAMDERSDVDHWDFGEVQDAGGWHDHALTPLRGAGPRKQTVEKIDKLILISRFENCKTRARACASTGLLTKTCTHKIAIGDSELINVRFGPLCRVKSNISQGLRSAKTGCEQSQQRTGVCNAAAKTVIQSRAAASAESLV